MPLLQQPTFPRLAVAMLMGALVGAERQWRQRPAGMRTATLVCFGAAAFADLGSTLAGPNSTGVIAYIVSGVGFLGAGAIMKEGASIRGLNTAATLWCSAAVGACAGAGELLDAVVVGFGLIGINLILRPISRFIDRRALARQDVAMSYMIAAVCSESYESEARAILLKAIAERALLLRQLRTEDIDKGEDVSVEAEVESSKRDSGLVNEIAGLLRSDPRITAVEVTSGTLDGE